MLIDSAPQPVFLPTDGDDDLVEATFITETAGRSPPDIIGELPAEFRRPQSYGLVRDDDTYELPAYPRPCAG